VERGVDPAATGVLVDEQFGSDVPKLAKEHGLKLAMPVEKSGQPEFDFQYGDAFGEHIAADDADFSKVLVRLNPEGDAETNERQLDRLKRLADWLHDHDRKFLFELLVPAEPGQLEFVGGDSDRYDAELRPELMRRASRSRTTGSRSTCGRSRASTPARMPRSWSPRRARARAARA
jgi:myo-inositol catabolism protein IolC